MGAILSELRQAARVPGRIPGTAGLSVATPGFGIAATTATFTAVYAALVRPIPFPDPDALLYLHTTRQTTEAGTVPAWRAGTTDPMTVLRRS